LIADGRKPSIQKRYGNGHSLFSNLVGCAVLTLLGGSSMPRRPLIGLTLACMVAVVSTQVGAETRIALVIGNSAYTHTTPLPNPRNDAELMAATLTQVGFSVTTVLDADQPTMKRALVDFGRILRSSNAVGLFYFAGHGVQVKGENYLIPIDANITDEAEIPIAAVNVNEFLATMERSQGPMNIVILDACRNNPFPGSGRGGTRGLAPVDAPSGTYIAYATAPGQTALDGNTANSPYTRSLASSITTPGIAIEEVFKRTRKLVQQETESQQTPWETSSITGDFFFVPPASESVHNPSTSESSPDRNVEIAFWASIKDSSRREPFDTYLAQYPNGAFAELARLKIDEIKAKAQQQQERPTGNEGAHDRPELFAQSSTVKLSDAELAALSCDQLWIARNEIFARNGYCFHTANAQSYFGNSACHTTSLDILSQIEQFNVSTIKTSESRKACQSPSTLNRQEFFPQSSTVKLSDADLVSLTCDQLWIARNEIFARNGYCFQSEKGQSYFGNLGCHTTSRDILSQIERANVAALKTWEDRKGCP
jgi:uncharacterized caspase-like protein